MYLVAGGCQLLESLFVRKSNVSRYGVEVAVGRLGNLRYLDSEHPLPPNERGIQRPTPSLLSFMCTRHGVVKMKCTLPLTDTVLSSKLVQANFVTNIDLAEVRDLLSAFSNVPRQAPNLDHLITFEGGVVQFLTRFGAESETVELLFLHRVDVCLILGTCRRLRNLTLFRISSFQSRPVQDGNAQPATGSNPPPSIVKCLEHFRFVGDLDSEEADCGELLSVVLAAPNLKCLEIENCPNLVDTLLLDAFNVHRFETLESLTLINCDELTRDLFVHLFLSRNNSLRRVKLIFCKNLCTISNRDEWQSLAKMRHWDLTLEMTMASG